MVGIFMKNWEDDDDSEFCSSNIDFVDAAAVAGVVGALGFAATRATWERTGPPIRVAS